MIAVHDQYLSGTKAQVLRQFMHTYLHGLQFKLDDIRAGEFANKKGKIADKDFVALQLRIISDEVTLIQQFLEDI